MFGGVLGYAGALAVAVLFVRVAYAYVCVIFCHWARLNFRVVLLSLEFTYCTLRNTNLINSRVYPRVLFKYESLCKNNLK